MAGEKHPQVIDPNYRDENGQPARVVLCPSCGHLELWTDEECQDHGVCRHNTEPCWCEQEEQGS